MPIELLVPLGMFVLGMIISDITSATAIKVAEESHKGK